MAPILKKLGIDKMTTAQKRKLVALIEASIDDTPSAEAAPEEWLVRLIEEREAAADADPDGWVTSAEIRAKYGIKE